VNSPVLRLPIATRVFTLQAQTPPKWDAPKPPVLPRAIGQRLIIHDHETRDEPAQRLLFGSFQIRDFGELVEGGMGLVVGDACPANGRRILEAFAIEHGMQLLTRDEFGRLFLAEVWEIGTTSVTFNAPWDHSRFACGWTAGEGKHRGAFTFSLSRNTYHPRLRIEALDSRKQFMEFTPSIKGQARNGWHKGFFVDVHSLVAALTDESMSLEKACRLYCVEHPKTTAVRHGVVSKRYIEYNLRDVQATYEVYLAAMRDFGALGL
jgi:hypothetical protein